jgi:hypothetical protein
MPTMSATLFARTGSERRPLPRRPDNAACIRFVLSGGSAGKQQINMIAGPRNQIPSGLSETYPLPNGIRPWRRHSVVSTSTLSQFSQ